MSNPWDSTGYNIYSATPQTSVNFEEIDENSQWNSFIPNTIGETSQVYHFFAKSFENGKPGSDFSTIDVYFTGVLYLKMSQNDDIIEAYTNWNSNDY